MSEHRGVGRPTTTTIVVLFVGVGLLGSLGGVILLALHGIEIPDALKTYIVGSVGMLGGILVPTASSGAHIVAAGED